MQNGQNNQRSDTGERMRRARQERLEAFPGAFERRFESGEKPSALRERIAAKNSAKAVQGSANSSFKPETEPVTGAEADELHAAREELLNELEQPAEAVTGREMDEKRLEKERKKAEKRAAREEKALRKQIKRDEAKLMRQEAGALKKEQREALEIDATNEHLQQEAERLEAQEAKLEAREAKRQAKLEAREAKEAAKLEEREAREAALLEEREAKQAAKLEEAAIRNDAKERRRELREQQKQERRAQREQQRLEDIESGAAARRKNALFIILALLLVAGFFVFVYFYATVDTISVRGNSRFTPEEIVNLSGLYTGRNIFLYDLDEAKAGVEKNTYIRCKKISRLFPNELLIQVDERKEFAAITASGGTASIIDREGTVLDVGRRGDTEGLITVLGMGSMGQTTGTNIGSDKTALRPWVLLEIFRAAGDRCSEISVIDVSNTASLRIVTANGVTVMLGDSVDVQQKIGYMFKALEKVDPERAPVTLYIYGSGKADISYPTPTPTPEPTPEPTPDPRETPEPDTTAEPDETDAGETELPEATEAP